MNNWRDIRNFYRLWTPAILKQRRDEWAMDPYEWDNGMIRMTPIERWLWADIRNCNAILYPQYPIGAIVVDFANPKAKVAIECDGAAYHRDKQKDQLRDRRLEDMGWVVHRITGSGCRTDSDDETGEPGEAHLFVRHICERHNIARNCTQAAASDWIASADSFTAEVMQELWGRNCVRRAFQASRGGGL